MSPNRLNMDEILEKGVTLVRSVLSAEESEQLTAELENALDEDFQSEFKNVATDKPDQWMVHNCMVRGNKMAKLLENLSMHSYLSMLLGDTCILYAYQSSSMPPFGSNYSNRIHVDSPRFIDGYTTNVGVIFPLSDFTLENGAPYFLEGSHLKDKTPAEDEFYRHARPILCKAGDMILFNARTFHLGGKNKTDKVRHALTMNVCRSYMRQRFDFPKVIAKEKPSLLSDLGEVGKRFLGFNVRMPTSLEEFYLPPDQRFYKPNQG